MNLYDPSVRKVVRSGPSGAMPRENKPAPTRPQRVHVADYSDYLRSKHWRELRNKYQRHQPWVCVCGAKSNLQLHHKTYERLGHERFDDLQPLCQDCHSLIHLLRDRELIPDLDLDPIHLVERLPEPSIEAWVSTRPKMIKAQGDERIRAEKVAIKTLAQTLRRKNPKLSRKQARHLAEKQTYRNRRDLVSSQSRPLL